MVASHTHVVRTLLADAIGRRRLVLLTQGEVTAAICRWQAAGLSVPTISGRWLVLRSALSWAVAEGTIRSNPLVGMRGPARPQPRQHHTLGEIRQILAYVEVNATRAMAALAEDGESGMWRRLALIAEQDQLLIRLAADSGARRGELAVLRRSDLDGRVLTIERGLSHGVLGSTKSARSRRLTLGATTAALINAYVSTWERLGVEPVGDWLFTPSPAWETYLTADALTQKFRRLGRAGGVTNPALHRLRHGVAIHLVDQGKLLKAQARLGDRDPSTKLRRYSHATMLDDLDDLDAADELDVLLNGGAQQPRPAW